MKTFSVASTTTLYLLAALYLLAVLAAQVNCKPTLYHSTNDYGYGGTTGFQQSSGFNSNYGYGHSNTLGLGGLGGGYLPSGYGGGYGPSAYGMAPVALGYPGAVMMPGAYLPGAYGLGYGLAR